MSRSSKYRRDPNTGAIYRDGGVYGTPRFDEAAFTTRTFSMPLLGQSECSRARRSQP
jgi:hypothetical protein